MQITLTGVKPYDGSYELDFDNELTTREWGWVKRLAGYLPAALEEAAVGGDPEFVCALAVIAMRRTNKVSIEDVPSVFERLIDAPFGSAITIAFPEEQEAGEDDAGPPALSSNGSESTSGTVSVTSSETSGQIPPDSGTPAWAISQSGPPTSET